MGDDNNVIPFGKHKGKTVEQVQLEDANYLEWLCAQAWFRDKFVVLHQTIINQGAPPEDTPEHNALQVLFLDDEFCLKVARAVVGEEASSVFSKRFETNGYDVIIDTNRYGFAIEIKPTVSDDYPSILRRMMACRQWGHRVLFLERFDARGATRQQFVDTFKASDISVVFRSDIET